MSGESQRFTWDAEDVRKAASGAWAAVLAGFGVDSSLLTNSHGPCPGCGGKDRFRFDDQQGSGSFVCSQGSGDLLSGDGIGLLAHVKELPWNEAVNMLGAAVCPEKGKPCRGNRSASPQKSAGPAIAPEPEGEVPPKRLDFDLEVLKRFQRADLPATRDWFKQRSPVAVAEVSAPGFLEVLYQEDERVLIFTDPKSQGQFLHWRGKGDFRLGMRPDVKAVRSPLPPGGEAGVWFLCQPVDGRWYPNARAKRLANGEMRLSRRSKESVTAWRYLVLESDEAPEDLWLNLLAQIPLPIAAIYTSGGRSVHALVKIETATKEAWDLFKQKIAPLFTRLGADAGALSAVRLTRLPGCFRNGKLQELLYLNPKPDAGGLPICDL